jgi:hypothetical protein
VDELTAVRARDGWLLVDLFAGAKIVVEVLVFSFVLPIVVKIAAVKHGLIGAQLIV